MQRMDRHLFSAQYCHGTTISAIQNIPAWPLMQKLRCFQSQDRYAVCRSL